MMKVMLPFVKHLHDICKSYGSKSSTGYQKVKYFRTYKNVKDYIHNINMINCLFKFQISDSKVIDT